jgi:hypothetical protein
MAQRATAARGPPHSAAVVRVLGIDCWLCAGGQKLALPPSFARSAPAPTHPILTPTPFVSLEERRPGCAASNKPVT